MRYVNTIFVMLWFYHVQYYADLSDITGVLQTDLLMPVTTGDQRVCFDLFMLSP